MLLMKKSDYENKMKCNICSEEVYDNIISLNLHLEKHGFFRKLWYNIFKKNKN